MFYITSGWLPIAVTGLHNIARINYGCAICKIIRSVIPYGFMYMSMSNAYAKVVMICFTCDSHLNVSCIILTHLTILTQHFSIS